MIISFSIRWFFSIIFLCAFGVGLHAQQLSVTSPNKVGMSGEILSNVNKVISKSIKSGDTPGAVLIVIRNENIVWRKAYGYKTFQKKDSMRVETVFDLASLTKPIATAAAVMKLIENGKISLKDRVSKFLPDFRNWHQSESSSVTPIRIIHLLTHTSGLPSYPPVDDLIASVSDSSARLTVIYNWINNIDRIFEPGKSFNYSGCNFVTLQRVIESVSESSLSKYTQRHIFKPLNMNKTTYRPPNKWRSVIAPTSKQLVGTVHDPFARKLMGGISGNAGLFSTAEDLAVFAAMFLNHGKWNGKQILSKASVETMTTIPSQLKSYGRGLGWDLNSSYSTNQGELFGFKTYGHTGFTGTSIVIDPDTDAAVILLTNGVYKNKNGNSVDKLRSLVANLVAAAIQ